MRKTLAEDARIRAKKTLLKLAGLITAGGFLTCSLPGTAPAGAIKTVFVIAMENHNWTQPANQFTGGIQQVYQNPSAPFINSLVSGTAFAARAARHVPGTGPRKAGGSRAPRRCR